MSPYSLKAADTGACYLLYPVLKILVEINRTKIKLNHNRKELRAEQK